jgi:hypothetical protein
MAARIKPGWASIPDMDPPPLGTDRELPALAAVVAILRQLDATERARVLRYVVERYGPTVRLGDGGEP